MRMNLIKAILIVVITAVLILIATPVVATASMEMTTNGCDTNPLHTKPSIPTCCLTADCPLTQCSLSNAVDNKVLLPSRFIPNKNVHITLHKTSVITDTSFDPQKLLQRDPTQELSSHLFSEYHCRNCLDSEEPPQV